MNTQNVLRQDVERWRNREIQNHASFCTCDTCTFSVDDILKIVRRGEVVLI